MAAGKVKKDKNQILNLVGKGGEYANDTDKKALKAVSYTHLTLPTTPYV